LRLQIYQRGTRKERTVIAELPPDIGRGSRGRGTDGTLRITADAAYPEIFPLTILGARGRGEPAVLAVPVALTQKWPAVTSLEGAPAYNVGRAYAAFAADFDNGTQTVPDFADAVRRHELIAAIERSAASGVRVQA